MTDSYFLDFFNKYIYKTEWDIYLDKEILIEDFKDFLNNCNLTDKIRILCFNKEKTLKDFLNLNEINESYCKRALTRLNKKTDIKITKKENGLNHYILTNKGLKNLINNTSSF